MQKCHSLSLRLQIRHFKNTFFQVGDLPFKNLLPDTLMKSIHQSGDVRETVFTPLVTLKAFLLQVLSPTGSCKEAVSHILTERLSSGHAANSMNTGPYCKARQRLSLSHLKEALLSVGQALHQQASSSWLWQGYRVVLLDGTSLLMPDTEDNQATYPQQSVQKPGLGFPIMRLVGLISLATGSCIDYTTGVYQGKGSGETSLFSRLISSLGKDDLLLADRYFTTYAIMAMMIEKKIPLVFRQRANVKSDFRKGQRLGSKDHIIEVKKPPRKPVWMTAKAYAELPNKIIIREFVVKGIIYVTTLFNTKRYPKTELAKLYQQRWKVELDFRTIKTHMGMEMLRCQSAQMVDKEVATHLLAYNLIRANLSKAASLNNKQPRHISFMAAVQLMRHLSGLCLTMTTRALEKLLSPLLLAMSSTEIGRRKRPNQPRVIKRRPKAFPLMTKPRCDYVNS